MQKRGIELSFNALVIAAIALVVLIVIIAIFVGNIRKGSDNINAVQDPYAKRAIDTAWCSSAYIMGRDCVSEDADNCQKIKIDDKSCTPAEPDTDPKTKQVSYSCKGDNKIHAVANKGIASSNTRYCCCP